MRACVQRVSRASVSIDGRAVAQINRGLVVLLGIASDDHGEDVVYLSEKILSLRIFDDLDGKMNCSVTDVAGELLVVSQFTLMGDCRRGRRPSFSAAAPPQLAVGLYEQFLRSIRQSGLTTESGVFRAQMQVELVNDGPVTLLLDSRKLY